MTGKMKLFKSYVIFGLILLIIGIVFDFTFVARETSNAFKTDPIPYLNSFKKQLYDLTKFYMIVLGFLNITLGLLVARFENLTKLDWIVFYSVVIGSLLLISTGFWYASAGPSFKWETRCTVLTIGIFTIVISLGLEIYRLLSTKNLQNKR